MDILVYLNAVRKHWWPLMSCALFTSLGAWILYANESNAWAIRATFSLAGFCLLIACYLAWHEEHVRVLTVGDEKNKLHDKYFDERPQIGLEIHGREGPTAWTSAYSRDICVFTLSQISGRRAQSIRFDPIPSKNGKFVLNFDPVPFLDPSPHSTPLRYEISEPPHQQLSGADREKTGDMEGQLLYLFLVDSPPTLSQLEYSLTIKFRDRDEMRSQTFKFVFDTRMYRFLPSTD